MLNFAILLTGFSIFSALLIALTHFRRENYQEQQFARVMGLVLLLALASLQLMHFTYLDYQLDIVQSIYYRTVLFAVAPAFYLFSKPVLQGYHTYQSTQLLHFLPVLVAPFIVYSAALPLSFLVGAAYLLALSHSIYVLRAQRKRFKHELIILGIVFLIALIVAILGMALNFISEPLFFSLYAVAIGIAFLLTNIALNYSPQLPVEISEAARESYTRSSLGGVDCEFFVEKLRTLMEEKAYYQRSNLDLSMLAENLGLSTHQLSELINTQMGKGFSRYVREYRISAAQERLISEPSASVLSIGMSVGFTTQSNFYAAFREIVGMTPGRYRKLGQQTTPE